MAITQAESGSGQTLDVTTEVTLWETPTDGPPHTEWYFKAGVGPINFKVYTGEKFIAYGLLANESERVGIRTGNITKITAQGGATATATWWPTVLIGG